MAAAQPALIHVQLPRQRLRKTAEYLLQKRSQSPILARGRDTAEPSIRVVCISDTHNLQPELSPGDLLIHTGDLTEWGTFDELQSQLTWLSSQPHPHKLVIAGNHDLLLDEEFLEKQPHRRDPRGRTRHDLDWGSVTFLQDESIRQSFADQKRTLNIYGSPWTPQYGTSAFQYPRDKDMWSQRVPDSTDILMTHGPPARFNDIKPSAGCAYLRREVARVKPRLMVFGHIHVARGQQSIVFDTAQRLYDIIIHGWRGWEAIPWMALAVVWSHMRQLVSRPVPGTTMVNAAVVDGMKKDAALDPIVVDL